MVYATSR